MAEKYKLTYFTVEAKGELIRLIFSEAEVPFENVRITFGEDWKALQPTTPFGCLPILEINDKDVLCGSGVIVRYLAEKYGLAGSTPLENAKIAGIKDFQDEIVLKMVRAFFESDEKKKATASEEIVKNGLSKYLGRLEKRIEENGSGWLYGPKLTYVDLNFYLVMDFMKLFKEENLLDGFPASQKLYDTIGERPKIAEWIKNRPERTFGPPCA